MSKKLFFLFLCTLTLSASCRSTPTLIPNPVIETDSAEEFAALGFIIDAPTGSVNQSYSIIAHEVAQINFSFSDVEYCVRAAKNTDWQTLSGVYEQFAKNPATQNFVLNGIETVVTVQTATTSAGKVAHWKIGNLLFTLYTPQTVSDETIFALAPLHIPFKTVN